MDSIKTAPRRQAKFRHRSLKLDKIRIDGKTQPRAGIINALVSEYAKDMEDNNAEFPPVVVFFDGVHYWLADGFHRFHAKRKNGLDAIWCEIHDGTVEDAQWYSCSANQAHGQRRSNEDKQNAVKAALLHPKGAGLSDSQIAEHVGVDDKTIGKYRKELEATSELPKSTTRTGKDGRTTDTSNIGTSKAVLDAIETEETPASKAARLLGVSEEMIAKAGRVTQSGRTEIITAVERGTMELDAAVSVLDAEDAEPDETRLDVTSESEQPIANEALTEWVREMFIKPSSAIAEDRWAEFMRAKLNELAGLIRWSQPATFAAELDAAVVAEGRADG